MAAKNNKVEEVSTITNSLIVATEPKKKIRLAAIVRAIEDKETSSGTAKRFKGDFALETDGITYRAKYLFLPAAIKDLILAQVAKVGKWSSLELVVAATRTETAATETTVAFKGWDVSFEIPARVEKLRVFSLLDA